MKRSLVILSAFLFVLMLVGCKPSEKTFSGSGVTVTLNKSFVETEVVQAPFYLQSKDHVFMANREEKSMLSPYGVNTTDKYIQAVLTNANKNSTVQTFNEGDVTYKYAYYTSTVNERTFGYMLIVMEGDKHFYAMNFGCLESKLEENKDLYIKWAKTITVE